VGGGFRDSRLGELAIARAEILLKAENFKVEMLPIHRHPDDAGLVGALHLAPSLIFETRRKKASDLSKACVWEPEL
jgi:hypothetical protein